MQAMPSVTSLSRTARWTSSVMSVTVSPPAVRRRVSCWNTFIVAAILRESLPDSAGEPPHPPWILRKPQASVAGDLCGEACASVTWAVDVHPPAERLDAVGQTHEPGSLVGIRTSATVVLDGDRYVSVAGRAFDEDRRVRRTRVL